MSRIYVRGPRSKDYRDVPYADIRYPPVSLFEIKAARAQLLAKGMKRIPEHEIFRAIELQRTLVDQARLKTRESRRAHTRRPPPVFILGPPSPASAIDYSLEPATYPVEFGEDLL